VPVPPSTLSPVVQVPAAATNISSAAVPISESVLTVLVPGQNNDIDFNDLFTNKSYLCLLHNKYLN